jgi:uncharacterized protein YbaP (TraB family)
MKYRIEEMPADSRDNSSRSTGGGDSRRHLEIRRTIVLQVRQLRRAIALALVATLASSAFVATHAAAESGKGFIWRIERGGRIGWLVGSIHVLTPDYYPLPDAMEKAFLRSTTLMEEADVTQMTSPEVIQLLTTKAIYTDGETLKTQLSPDTYQMAADRLARFGLPMETFERMRPWMMTLTLVAAEMKRAGFDAEHGVDRHFFDRAAPLGKHFRTLETLAEQLDIFASFSPKVQEAMLRDTLKSLDSEISQMKTVADVWQSGDAAALERIVLEPMMKEPALYDAMIVKRNRNWVPKIEDCLASGHCFVVVGAAHLLGPDGLLAALRQKGYAVQQE